MSSSEARNLENSCPIIAVVGATGTGKSKLAVLLANQLEGEGKKAEIINADAMQLYRGMDIGTAKLTVAERLGVPHHLLDVWEVTKAASVAEYQILARAAINEVQSRAVIPILVGGSGLYVSSVVYDFDFPGTDPKIRAELEIRAEIEGREILVAELAKKDPLAAAAIDPSNLRRVIRALEVIRLTGKPFKFGLDAQRRAWRPSFLFGLRVTRERLFRELNSRVDDMWNSRFIEEVENLKQAGLEKGVTAARAIGYSQALEFLSGKISRPAAIEDTKLSTRHYSRRQMSWFGRDPRITWFEGGGTDNVGKILETLTSQ
tara:strand:- start:154 stop:1107 length:954 start_codon:yes stop_codon:yes gene_type:complete